MEKQIFMILLKKKEFKAVKEILENMNEVDILDLLKGLDDKELIQTFRLMEKSKGARVFSVMSQSMQTHIVSLFEEEELADILEDLYMDDAVDFVEELPANLVTRILDRVEPEKRNMINLLLTYPEDSAGSIMTTEYVSLKKDMTVKDSLKHIKETGIYKETIYTCYILENRKLVGIVTAKNLLTSDDNLTMREIMNNDMVYVNTFTDQEDTAKLFNKYGFLAIPVVDKEGFMVGIVTVDDALGVMVAETTEDIELMNALSPSDDSYFDMSVFTHAKNRIGWLLFLMISATITQTIIANYETAFQKVPLLVSFIPMLTDTGGNCGSQSSSLVIRGLATDQMRFKDVWRIIFKELRVAILVSIALSFVNGLYIYIRYQNLPIAIVVGISLTITVILSKLIGAILPMAAEKVNLDPAIMAAPLITTIVDTSSIAIYFAIATKVLNTL